MGTPIIIDACYGSTGYGTRRPIVLRKTTLMLIWESIDGLLDATQMIAESIRTIAGRTTATAAKLDRVLAIVEAEATQGSRLVNVAPGNGATCQHLTALKRLDGSVYCPNCQAEVVA